MGVSRSIVGKLNSWGCSNEGAGSFFEDSNMGADTFLKSEKWGPRIFEVDKVGARTFLEFEKWGLELL